MKVQTLAKIGLVLALIAALFGGVILPASAAQAPVLKVVGVYPGSMVQLQVTNMPAAVDFAVTMGKSGSGGVGPTVAHIISSDGGTQTFWVEILADVRSNAVIDVRINSGTGLVAFTSFNNLTTFTAPAATAVPTATTVTTGGTGGAVTTTTMFTVLHVQKGGWVSVAMRSLPASTTFTVTFGKKGTAGLGGQVMAHVTTSDTPPALAIGTFEIPVSLSGETSLDIRIEGGGITFVKTFQNIDF